MRTKAPPQPRPYRRRRSLRYHPVPNSCLAFRTRASAARCCSARGSSSLSPPRIPNAQVLIRCALCAASVPPFRALSTQTRGCSCCIVSRRAVSRCLCKSRCARTLDTCLCSEERMKLRFQRLHIASYHRLLLHIHLYNRPAIRSQNLTHSPTNARGRQVTLCRT